jgi:hypothetical protein
MPYAEINRHIEHRPAHVDMHMDSGCPWLYLSLSFQQRSDKGLQMCTSDNVAVTLQTFKMMNEKKNAILNVMSITDV